MASKGRVENAVQEPLTTEQVDKYAELVAAGEAEFPSGLPKNQEEDLISKIRSRLRRRLVLFIAREIARDVRAESERQLEKTIQ